MPVPEAPLEATEFGLVSTGPGWFAVNVPDARWPDVVYERFGEAETVPPYGGSLE